MRGWISINPGQEIPIIAETLDPTSTVSGRNRSGLKIRLRAEARVRALATKVKKKK